MKHGGARLKAWRGKRTQAEIAELLGVNQGTVSRLELGVSEPGVALACKLEQVTEGRVPISSWAQGEQGVR